MIYPTLALPYLHGRMVRYEMDQRRGDSHRKALITKLALSLVVFIISVFPFLLVACGCDGYRHVYIGNVAGLATPVIALILFWGFRSWRVGLIAAVLSILVVLLPYVFYQRWAHSHEPPNHGDQRPLTREEYERLKRE